MRCMTMYKLLSFLLLVIIGASSYAQTIDPSKQINWNLGPISNMLPAMVNGVPQVASWSGSDACAKLHNAMIYALANSLPLVDATGLIGIQACASNPFFDITGSSPVPNAPVNLTINFGATHFKTTVPWVIINSALQLRGLGPWSTQVEYTGPIGAAAVLTIDGSAGTGPYAAFGINGTDVTGIWFYGDTISSTANVTDALLLKFVNRSKFDSIYAWGASGCGIHTMGAVTDTFIRPRVSSADATFLGIDSGAHQIPNSGLCLGGITGVPGGNEDTTSGSVIDAGMEGLPGVGIHLLSADQMTIQGGTSETNVGGGILINSSASGVNSGVSNKFNMVLSMDLEGNGPDFTGDDITDNGQLNTFINVLASSPCSSPCTASVYLTGGGSAYFLNGFPTHGIAGTGGSGASPAGFTASSATGGSASALPGTPSGYIVEQVNGANVKIPFYNP